MMMIAPNSRTRNGGKVKGEYGGISREEEEEEEGYADYRGIV